MTFDVACIGNLVADVIAKPVTRLPDRGKLDLVDSMSLHSGGCAMNTGVALCRLGLATAVMGKVGADGFGDFLRGRLEAAGADTTGLVGDPHTSTSSTMVMLSPDGERSFIHYIGANATYSHDDVDFGVIGRSRLLHVAGFYLMSALDGEPTARVLAKARELGTITALDTCWDSTGRWLPLIECCFPFVDYFLPSLDEARMITGLENPRDIAGFLLDRGVGTVGIKMGGEGCYVRNRDAEVSVPPFAVEAIDATGAGDSWVAGFLAGVVRGMDPESAATLANAVGACCVRGLGASSGILPWDETLRFIERTPRRR